MSHTVIKVENLSKQYRLGEVGTGTLSHDINRWWYKVRGKEDPFLKIGEENDRTTRGDSDYVWVLKHLNFDIEHGEILGIIGRNGAGKSTLLKILSRTTTPTTGHVKIKGRVASLLEVGTGFHPELSGRDNIFLNGAILGMTKSEIKRKFDEIVDFSGVERYIDTPVKRYSSGMYVRLAFGVAAHLESEILIVDEVLAVGDSEFQKKCIGKMGELSSREGRTVLFVSHQLGMLSKLCNKAILLKQGKIELFENTSVVIDHYLAASNMSSSNAFLIDPKDIDNKECYIESASTVNADNKPVEQFSFDENIGIRLKVKIVKYNYNALVGIGLQDKMNVRVCTFFKPLSNFVKEGDSEVELKIELPAKIIAPNIYSFVFAIFETGQKFTHIVESACSIKIVDTGTEFSMFEGIDYGNVIINPRWNVE